MKIPKHITEYLLNKANSEYEYEPAPIRIRINRDTHAVGKLIMHQIPKIVVDAIAGKTVWGVRSWMGVRVFPNSQIEGHGFSAWWLPTGAFSVVAKRKKQKAK